MSFSKLIRNIKKKPCVTNRVCWECPFKKNALPNFFAYKDGKELLEIVNAEVHIPCSQTIPEEGESGIELYCRGALQFMKKNAKKPRDKELDNLVQTMDGEDLTNIMSVPEFINHHTKKNKEYVFQTRAED